VSDSFVNNLSVPEGSSLAELLSETVLSWIEGPLAGHETTREALFTLLVAGVDLYVQSVLVEEETLPLGAGSSLASLAVDGFFFENPELFRDAPAARYMRHLELTLGALAENLDCDAE
jgi:hypothetical protein